MTLPRILHTFISWFTKPEPVNREHRLSELAARRARLRRSCRGIGRNARELCVSQGPRP